MHNAETFLEDTQFDGSGSFSLSPERASQLLARQESGICWEWCRLVQAAVEWGSRSITFPEQGSEWSVLIGHPSRLPDLQRLTRNIVELGLDAVVSGEQLVAASALGLGAQDVEMSWGEDGKVLGSALLLGFPKVLAALPTFTRWIHIRFRFPDSRSPPYSSFQGGNLVAYAPLRVGIGKWYSPTQAGEARHNWFGTGGYFWLEYFRASSANRGFQFNPSGRTRTELGKACPRFGGGVTSDLRCRDGEGEGDLLILVRWGFERETRFHPVQSGVLLSWLSFPELPSGFQILFDADGLKTDLSGRELICNDALKERLRSYLPEIVKACHLLEKHSSRLSRRAPWYIPLNPILSPLFMMSGLCVAQLTPAGVSVGSFFAMLTTWGYGSLVKDYWERWEPYYKDFRKQLATVTQRWIEVAEDWPTWD